MLVSASAGLQAPAMVAEVTARAMRARYCSTSYPTTKTSARGAARPLGHSTCSRPQLRASVVALATAADPQATVEALDELLRWCIEERGLPPCALEPAWLSGDAPSEGQRPGLVASTEVQPGEVRCASQTQRMASSSGCPAPGGRAGAGAPLSRDR
jgi:hypothetical protein